MRHSDRDLIRFGRKLGRLAGRWRRGIDARMRRFGLTDATWRPLLRLGLYGDGIRQRDLAAGLEIECASLVRLLDALERDELIERRIAAEDRRIKTLHMTAAGRTMYARVMEEYLHAAAGLLEQVEAEDLAACLRVFERLERMTDADRAD